jgi:DNA-binding transcriptional ArsR family regulator
MVLVGTADNALQVAHTIALRTAETLSTTARKIYTALVATGLEVALEREYSPKVTQVVFFACAESVALACNVHPSTLYRKLPELRQAGLVHAVGHFCTHNSQTRLDGTVWAVRVTPGRGSKVRIGFDWLKRSYRCLGADIEAGRTAWLQMRESKSTRDKSAINLSDIRRWTLSQPSKAPIKVDSRTIDLASILDVPAVPKQSRAEKIFEAAKAMSVVLNDNGSHRFYMAVLWNLTKLRDRGAGDYFAMLHMMVSRCSADVFEGFAHDGNGGKLLVSRLKETAFWDEIMKT